MKKLNELRAAITAAFPPLQTNPDALLVFADNGAIVSTNGPAKAFEYRYTAHLILTDFTGDADALMFALLSWVSTNQRELLENDTLRANAIAFEVDALNNESCDISIKLALTEAVAVALDADNKPTFTHQAEKIPEWEITGTLYPGP